MEHQNPPFETRKPKVRLLVVALVLFFALTAPYGLTKLNGDEVHFVTIPYLMFGGDYTLSAVSRGDYGDAFAAAAESYALMWRYYVRPADAPDLAGQALTRFPVTRRASEREEPFVVTPNYFSTHRKSGKPLLSFIIMAPSLAGTFVFPKSLFHYQREYIYHPAFYVTRFTFILIGLASLLAVYFIVRERWGEQAGGFAAIAFAVVPATPIWTPDLHQDLPLGLFLLLFSYYVWKGRLVMAGVCWGLAFAVKNQAVFGLAPLVAEAIWVFCDAGTLRERIQRAAKPLIAFAVVLAVGLVASAPFGHPIANLKEVVSTSAPSFGEEIYQGNALFLWLPLWMAMGFLGLLGLHFLDLAKDSFDRYQILFLIIPGFLHFFVNSRLPMLVPATAVLIGSYFRAKTFYFLMAALMVINLYGIEEPYLTSRGIGYRFRLRVLEVPYEIGAIEGLLGVGSMEAEEAKLERRRLLRDTAPVEPGADEKDPKSKMLEEQKGSKEPVEVIRKQPRPVGAPHKFEKTPPNNQKR